MPYGYNGKILRIDLISGEIWVDEHSRSWYRTHMGGRNIGLYYLLKDLAPEADPLGPENIMIFAPSVITGAAVPGISRITISAKSPLTGLLGESQAGGYWGPALKWSGFDAVVVRGKAEYPVYISIGEQKAEIVPAKDIWTMTTADATQRIRDDLNASSARVLSIGPAGENLVRFACIIDQARHTAGRCGLGAVMGSKNLKALAVNGAGKTETADPEFIKNFAKSFANRVKTNADTSQLHRYGTSNYFINANTGGALPTRNWNQAVFEGAEKVSHLEIDDKLEAGHDRCFACTVRCKRTVKSDAPLKIDPVYGAPEFETMTAFTSNLSCDDVFVLCKAHEICNAYGMDTISAGATISWAMECFEKGVLKPEETNGLSIRFGEAEKVLGLLEMIAKREGFGDILAEGSARAAESIGRDSIQYSMSVKGQEFAMHEPRSKMGLGYHFALSPTGADHIQAEHDGAFDPNLVGYTHEADAPSFFMEQTYPLGLLEPVPSLTVGEQKARQFFYLQHHFSFMDVLCICVFTTAPVRITTFDEITQIVNAVTGWNTSFWEIMKAGERGVTMARCFNLIHGLGPEDDRLPERMHQPLVGGSQEGSFLPKEEFEHGVGLYYEMNGWDKEYGIPSEGKLIELDLGWVRDALSGVSKKGHQQQKVI